MYVVWPRKLDEGPNWREFYERFGGGAAVDVGRQMLSELLAAIEENAGKAPGKSALFPTTMEPARPAAINTEASFTAETSTGAKAPASCSHPRLRGKGTRRRDHREARELERLIY